jgi:hypothetical protein
MGFRRWVAQTCGNWRALTTAWGNSACAIIWRWWWLSLSSCEALSTREERRNAFECKPVVT